MGNSGRHIYEAQDLRERNAQLRAENADLELHIKGRDELIADLVRHELSTVSLIRGRLLKEERESNRCDINQKIVAVDLEVKLSGALATITDLRMKLAEEREAHEATKRELSRLEGIAKDHPNVGVIVARYVKRAESAEQELAEWQGRAIDHAKTCSEMTTRVLELEGELAALKKRLEEGCRK